MGYYHDVSDRTIYFVGEGFRDLSEIDWTRYIPSEARNTTMVVLDDHQSSIRRVRELLALGFTHLWYDDNNKFGNLDEYNFAWMCSPLGQESATSVLYKDQYGLVTTIISVAEHRQN